MSFQQIIYNRLRYHGITQAGALGILGNLDCESNCEPYRLQGDFSPYRTQSKAYVQNIMNGSISKADFCDGRVGKFIAQWTYPTRQAALWDFWKARGGAIDDAAMQTDFIIEELKGYPQLLAFLKTTTDIFTACSRVCREYERPAVNNIDARYAAAKRIQYEIDLDGGGDEPEPEPTPQPEPVVDHSLKLRTIDFHCESFPEFDLMRSSLKCRNYTNAYAWDGLKQFQKDNGLTPDGVCGPITWAELLKLG